VTWFELMKWEKQTLAPLFKTSDFDVENVFNEFSDLLILAKKEQHQWFKIWAACAFRPRNTLVFLFLFPPGLE